MHKLKTIFDDETRISIGDICFSLLIPHAETLRTVRLHYRDYLAPDALPDIVISVKNKPSAEQPKKNNIIMQGSSWQLYQRDGELGIYFSHKTNPAIAVFDNHIGRVEVFSSGINPSLFLYLLPELVLGLTLHDYNALFVHACGLIVKEKGCLFVAESGGGKSTLARLALNDGFTLLNDDRIIVAINEDMNIMHSTPWHGEIDYVSNLSAHLSCVFFLEKSVKPYIAFINKRDAIIELFKNTFALQIDTGIIQKVLALCSSVVSQTQCYRLGFNLQTSLRVLFDEFFRQNSKKEG